MGIYWNKKLVEHHFPSVVQDTTGSIHHSKVEIRVQNHENLPLDLARNINSDIIARLIYVTQMSTVVKTYHIILPLSLT